MVSWWISLFLTSKVRLHCDWERIAPSKSPQPPFPDLKGQAPLRQWWWRCGRRRRAALFLTSKVRLHCDLRSQVNRRFAPTGLFLTSKVRLHCDDHRHGRQDRPVGPFPDLKGQAPLRLADNLALDPLYVDLFLTSKVRLHCDSLPTGVRIYVPGLFLTSKVRLHCDYRAYEFSGNRIHPFPDLKGQAPLRPFTTDTGTVIVSTPAFS